MFTDTTIVTRFLVDEDNQIHKKVGSGRIFSRPETINFVTLAYSCMFIHSISAQLKIDESQFFLFRNLAWQQQFKNVNCTMHGTQYLLRLFISQTALESK